MNKITEINLIITKTINETTNPKNKKALEDLRPKRNILDTIRNRDISQEEYTKILTSIHNIAYLELSQKYPFSLTQNKTLNSKLSIALTTFYKFHYSISFKQNKAKIYPIALDEKTIRIIYKNELLSIVQEHMKSNETYEDIINKRITIYEERTNFYKQVLKEKEIPPYYGTPVFMYNHASYIIECAKKLPFKTKDMDSTINEMKRFTQKYPEVYSPFFEQSYPYYGMEYKTEYEKFEQNYLAVLSFEKALMPLVLKIWQEYLSNPKNHNNSSFKYIVFPFIENLMPIKEISKARCCLVSENLLATPYGSYGLIYDFNPDALEGICLKDNSSWEIDKAKFIDRNIPLNMQLTENNIFYENSKVSRLILPRDIEKNGIANNLVDNGELLNYATFCNFSEILLNRNAKPIGVFYTDNCRNIEEVREYAKRNNLPLIHLSLSELRIQAGLNPIVTKFEPTKEVSTTLSY